MALNTPVDLQQATYPAQADRLIWQLLFANTGVVQSGDLLPTQSITPAMSVLLAAGACVLNVTGSTFVGLGSYLTVNDSSITATIAASSPSLPRIDIVGIVINDGYVSGVLNSAVLTVLTGVPNASPVAPSIPTNMIPIASVAVAANATSIVNANITDLRTRSTHTELVAGTANAAAAPFTIQLATAQTGNALTIKNSAGVTIGYLDSNGVPHGSLTSIFTANTVSASQSALAFNDYYVTVAGVILTFPSTPNVNDEIHVFDLSGSAATTPIVVNSNGQKINGTVQNLNIDKNYGRAYLKYTGSSYGWEVF